MYCMNPTILLSCTYSIGHYHLWLQTIPQFTSSETDSSDDGLPEASVKRYILKSSNRILPSKPVLSSPIRPTSWHKTHLTWPWPQTSSCFMATYCSIDEGNTYKSNLLWCLLDVDIKQFLSSFIHIPRDLVRFNKTKSPWTLFFPSSASWTTLKVYKTASAAQRPLCNTAETIEVVSISGIS